ncbi:MAG: hypothetical protein R2726_10145 [Acidimicrobiales bacterium]
MAARVGHGGFTSLPPTFGRNANGSLSIFVTGTDNNPYRATQTVPSGPFSGWNIFAGQFSRRPVLASNGDGRLELFGIGTDGAMWRCGQSAPNSSLWTGFSSLGGWLVAS